MNNNGADQIEWSAPLIFAYNKIGFSIVVSIMACHLHVFQNFIKERFLSKAHTHSETQLFETPGKEWTPGRDYVILGDKPLNKVRQGHQPRSLSFLIKHIKTGRKLVLKVSSKHSTVNI